MIRCRWRLRKHSPANRIRSGLRESRARAVSAIRLGSTKMENVTSRSLVLCGAALLAAACTRMVDGTARTGIRRRTESFRRRRRPRPARSDPDARDHRRRRAPHDHSVDGRQVPDRHRHTRQDCAAAMPVRLRGHRHLRTRHRRVPQDDVPIPTARRADIRRRRRLSRCRVPHIMRSTRWWQPSGTARTPRTVQGSSAPWIADEQSLQTRPGDCGRDYEVKSVVLMEVTFCGFPESVSTIVITNIAANVPG